METERTTWDTITKQVVGYGQARLLFATGASKRLRDSLVAVVNEVEALQQAEGNDGAIVPVLKDEPKKKKSKGEPVEKVWQRIMEEVSKLELYASYDFSNHPDEADVEGNVRFFATEIKRGSMRGSAGWVGLCEYARTFYENIIRAANLTLAIKTILAYEGKEDNERDRTIIETRSLILKRWEEMRIGFAFSYVLRMTPVAELIKTYPRLQAFSSPAALIPHVTAIRSLIERDTETRLLFVRPLSTIKKTATEMKVARAQADGLLKKCSDTLEELKVHPLFEQRGDARAWISSVNFSLSELDRHNRQYPLLLKQSEKLEIAEFRAAIAQIAQELKGKEEAAACSQDAPSPTQELADGVAALAVDA